MLNEIGLPLSTIINKPVPKNAFCKRATDGQRTSLQRWFTEDFLSITWLYKLTAQTLNVAESDDVVEIDIFYCKMKNDSYNATPFTTMDKLMPHHTLYVIAYGEKHDILMHFKRPVMLRGEKRWQCGEREMMCSVQLTADTLHIEGYNISTVYYSLLGQVSGMTVRNQEDYERNAALRQLLRQIEKQIVTLQSRICKERQFNRQVEMNDEARRLKRQAEELKRSIKADE